MSAIDTSAFDISTFDLYYALAGGTLFAKNRDDGLYYVATGFSKTSGDKLFPYRAKVDGNYYNFNSSGVTNLDYYTLYCAATKESSGSGSGSSQGSSGSGEMHPGISHLNAKESTALHVLNAMIKHMDDPLSYKDTVVKLLTQKAFEFSNEFIGQALLLREEEGEIDPGSDSGSGSGGGSSTYIKTTSLNDLSAIKKIIWCTEYPATGEPNTLYVKFRVKAQQQ